jgi:hypothetical protein
MQELTFDQLLEATRTLGPQERQVLAQTLQLASALPQAADSFVEAEVLNEAGAFSVFTPLHDAHPHKTVITDAELVAAAQCISCEWEEDPLL